MAVLTVEEFINKIKEHTGDDASDETIQFIEDATDTINSLNSKSTTDGEDWKTKYEENDKEWRKRYKERFFSSGDSDGKVNPNNSTKDEDENNDHEKTIDELFSKGD